MDQPSSSQTSAIGAARDMMRLHGLKAQAVATEQIEAMRRQGDAAALHRWEQTYAAICELRRTAGGSSSGH